jgi:hypothetical protein
MSQFILHNPNKELWDLLCPYMIKRDGNCVWIEDNVIDEWISDSNLSIFDKLIPEIHPSCPSYYFILGKIYRIGSVEFIRQIQYLNLCPLTCFSHIEIIMKEIVSRPDDNVEIFDLCNKRIDFSSHIISFEDYEKDECYCCSLLFTCLKKLIYNGNHRIFEYITTNFGLKKEYILICQKLKKLILTTTVFNPKILDLLMKKFIDIRYDDITFVIQDRKLPQLEYIVHLIENRIIILNQYEIDRLHTNIKRQPLEIQQLFGNKN